MTCRVPQPRGIIPRAGEKERAPFRSVRRRAGYRFRVALACVLACLAVSAADAQGHLARGISLYHAGEHDEALYALNTAVENTGGSPLAYYYAALIRAERRQYDIAEKNLARALADSAGFSDAHGLRAHVLDRMGEESRAREEWRLFIEDAGVVAGAEALADTIMPPARYRTLAAERKAEIAEQARERERLAALNREMARKAEQDSLARAQAAEDSLRQAERAETAADSAEAGDETTGSPEAATSAGTFEEELAAVNERFESGLRRGLLFLGIAVVAVIAAGVGITVYVRRRFTPKRQLAFTDEVRQLLRERENEDIAMSVDEEYARERFESVRGDLDRAVEDESPSPPGEDNGADTGTGTAGGSGEPEAARRMAASETPHRPAADRPRETDGSRAGGEPLFGDTWEPAPEPDLRERPQRFLDQRRPITEDVKALVTRMSREGAPVEEICRASDLTKTEVELIIAVRARQMEDLVEEAADRDDDYEPDRLHTAVRELTAQGDSTVDIARKLGISTSEVTFARHIIENTRR